MIVRFADQATEDIFNGVRSPAARRACPPDLWAIVARKLDLLDSAAALDDLRAPPGNRLERLRGDLEGKYSIRVNSQYRIVFEWTTNGPDEVQVVDYHR